MAEMLTQQQKAAVINRGGKLLVSAAAGSGKTKVLVDRLMCYLQDESPAVNLDDFLIITYTKAAASELRGKIAAKLSERIAEAPENLHLQRQMQRLYLTKISTVHSFCADLLKEYAHLVDIPGDFRVADERECAQLRESVMMQLLETAFENAHEDKDFQAFADAQGLGRDDRLIPQILFQVYDSARCHLDPEQWLQSCIESTKVHDIEDAAQTPWGNYLMEDLFHYLDLQIQAMERCVQDAQCAEGMEKPAILLAQTLEQLKHLRCSPDWDTILLRKQIDYGRLVISKKCPDQELADRIKVIRDYCKKGLERKLKNFTDTSGNLLREMAMTETSVRGIVSLVRRFDKAYSVAKQSRRILDFGDLEHRVLDLLWGKRRSTVTAVAREIGSRFCEIMVDEYQDSNAVQDAIFTALTEERKNCFMVGDVKQSIYQFRLADPGIFLDKYNCYSSAETAVDGEGRKVCLSQNFRSGGAVLAAVNDIFAFCMSPRVGGLHYGADEALYEGLPHGPIGEPEVEFWTVPVRENTYPEEAALVAQRVAQLLESGSMVRDKDGLRPVLPHDIAILLRSPGSSAAYYVQALAARGIRCVTGGGEDLLKTQEISVLRSILQTISNPRQDIPLIAALASPVFRFTADDLAAVRSSHKGLPFYDALCRSDMEKAKTFLQILKILRQKARFCTLVQMIQQIFLLTGMDNLYGAMENGEQKLENLQFFCQQAAEFESVGRKDLEQFLEHLDSLEEKGFSVAGEMTVSGAVTLCSIHKSKGLEFPVVIVAGLSRSFNTESSHAQVLCDQKLGLGLSVVDTKNRLRYPTLAKRAIGAKVLAEGLSEEMRVLYVALTRAKDRLIMTYAAQKPEKDILELSSRLDMCPRELLSCDVVCPGEWVMMTALRHTEAGELFATSGRPMETKLGDPVWKICLQEAPEYVTGSAITAQETLVSATLMDTLQKNLSFSYGHEAATKAPSKQTATQLKGRYKDQEVDDHRAHRKGTERMWRKPSFAGKQMTGADYGNAMHKTLQYLRFECCENAESVRQELERLATEGNLTAEAVALVDAEKIARFFSSDIGKQLRQGNVIREFKFSVLLDGSFSDSALEGEKILLQGVVDCALIEDDGITVLDFKTDQITEENLPSRVAHYLPQVQAYAQALEKIYQKPVKRTLLYFFHLERLVDAI